MSNLENKQAPDFRLQDQDGKWHSLADYKGKKVLLYFYPKDMTSGCTVEACSFRDNLGSLKKIGVVVLGVSADDTKSHGKFAEKEKLNFPLLADVEKKAINAYGVWVEKSMYGKKYMGIQRDSFLIDEKGVVVKHYKKVKPEEHVAEVMRDAA
ncbi:MAG: thioredoxin-dependent thiol peroxidase [Candidatus Gracilibacteria bacterium]